jgi:hypothetical protein
MLRAWGQIGDDGLTEIERAEALQRQRKLEETEKASRLQELNRKIEYEIQETAKSAADKAWEACAPARNKRRIKSAVIWSIICLCGAIVLANWKPASERSEQTYHHAINFALFIWLVGIPFVWLGPTSTPEYERIKKSMCEAARQGVLAKHGPPPAWTPLTTANPSQIAPAAAQWPDLNAGRDLDRADDEVGRRGMVTCPHCETPNTFAAARLESFKRSGVFTCQKCGIASDVRI